MTTDSRLANILSLVLTLLLVAPPGVAFAGAEEAREFFKEAKQAYGSGEYEKAASLLKKAYAEEANLTYQYNRVRALEGAGKYTKALEVLETYEKPMLEAKGFEDVPKLKASLEKKVEKDPDDTEAADSLRDDSEEEGDAEQTADDAGTAVAETDTGDEATTTSRSSSNRKTMQALGWGLTGVGIGALTVGSLYGSMMLLPSGIRTKVQNNEGLSPDQRSRFNTHRTMSAVFLSVGAAAAIGGGVVLLTQGGQSDSGTQTAAHIEDPTVAPFVSRDGGGAVLNFRF
jgi:hypothetical protein